MASSNVRPRSWPVATVLIAGCVVVAAGCGPTEVEGLPLVDGAPEVRVEAVDFAFVPAELRLGAGEPVNVVLEVTDGGHNLAVADTEFRLPIVDEGERTSGGLVIDEPGTYQLVCTVPGHLAAGMVGSVVVE